MWENAVAILAANARIEAKEARSSTSTSILAPGKSLKISAAVASPFDAVLQAEPFDFVHTCHIVSAYIIRYRPATIPLSTGSTRIHLYRFLLILLFVHSCSLSLSPSFSCLNSFLSSFTKDHLCTRCSKSSNCLLSNPRVASSHDRHASSQPLRCRQLLHRRRFKQEFELLRAEIEQE